MMRAFAAVATCLIAGSTLLSTGCVGIYNNEKIFMPPPRTGMSEGDLLRTYGTPAFAGFAEDEKIYTYKVREVKYIVLVGLYNGYDLVVTCQNGEVTRVDRVQRPETFAFLQPHAWATTD